MREVQRHRLGTREQVDGLAQAAQPWRLPEARVGPAVMGSGQQRRVDRRVGRGQSAELRERELDGIAGRVAAVEQISGNDDQLHLVAERFVDEAREGPAYSGAQLDRALAQDERGRIEVHIRGV